MSDKQPSGTTMEGMIYNANRILSLALHPVTKKSVDILEHAKGIMVLNTVEVGLVLAGTRGSGVVMGKNADGTWSAPSAVTLTSLKVGMIVAARDKGLVFVFTDDGDLDNFLSGPSIEIGAGYQANTDRPIDRDPSAVGVSSYLTNKGRGSVFSYTFKVPQTFEPATLDSITIKHQAKANERFYGKSATPMEIVREGAVTAPDGSGIPELHKKLALLEAKQTVEPTPDTEAKEEALRKQATDIEESVKAELGDEIEEVKPE